MFIFFAFVIFNVFSTYYKNIVGKESNQIFNKEYLNKYLLEESVPGEYRFNTRYGILVYSLNNVLNSFDKMLFGNSYGLYKGSFVGKSSFVKDNRNYFGGSGTTWLLFLWMQGGIIIVLLYFIYMFYKTKYIFKIKDSRLKHFAYFVYIIAFIPWIYNRGYGNPFFCMVIAYMFIFINNLTPPNKTSKIRI